MRHNQEDENRVDASLISLAKHDVKIIATNNTFYIDKENSNAHDILLCVRDGENKLLYRSWSRLSLRIAQSEYYFKSGDEMKQLLNCLRRFRIFRRLWIRSKFSIWREVLLPKFEIRLNLIILKTQLMAEYEVKMRI
jgi:DNA polymerase-3 subunit alpha